MPLKVCVGFLFLFFYYFLYICGYSFYLQRNECQKNFTPKKVHRVRIAIFAIMSDCLTSIGYNCTRLRFNNTKCEQKKQQKKSMNYLVFLFLHTIFPGLVIFFFAFPLLFHFTSTTDNQLNISLLYIQNNRLNIVTYKYVILFFMTFTYVYKCIKHTRIKKSINHLYI